MVKIADVAREAGVSTATVSRVLNDLGSVRPELSARVKDAANKLGYEPNRLARSLRRQRSSVWALVIADIENPFFTSVARGVEEVAQQLGYSVILCNSEDDVDRESSYLRVAEQEQVAGVIFSPHSPESSVSRLDRAGIPVVLIDRPLSSTRDLVTVDSESGAYVATQHLLESGWRRPACITGPRDVSTAVARARGYERAMIEAGLTEHIRIEHGSYRFETGARAVRELVAHDHPPDAYFAASSTLALGAMRTLLEIGQKLREDVGMVMYDDTPWAPFLSPAMSVVYQPAQSVGHEAARLLAARIAGGKAEDATLVELQPRLIARESSIRPRQP